MRLGCVGGWIRNVGGDEGVLPLAALVAPATMRSADRLQAREGQRVRQRRMRRDELRFGQPAHRRLDGQPVRERLAERSAERAQELRPRIAEGIAREHAHGQRVIADGGGRQAGAA